MCPELSVDGFSFEKGIHSEKKKKKNWNLFPASCLKVQMMHFFPQKNSTLSVQSSLWKGLP